MFDNTVIKISKNFCSSILFILFNWIILVGLKNCLKHCIDNNVEQNSFKLRYLEYPVFQGWVSSNQYDMFILKVAFAICVCIWIYSAISYAEYCIPAVLLFYAMCGFVIQESMYTSWSRQNKIEMHLIYCHQQVT